MKPPVDLLIKGAAQLVTPRDRGSPCRGGDLGEPRIIRNGALAVRGGRIAAIGTTPALSKRFRPKRTLDASGRVLTPGLVDPHTHFIFAGDRFDEFELRLRGASYEQISRGGGGILSSVRRTRSASLETLVEESLPRLRRMLATGTTTAEIKSGYALDPTGEIRMLEAVRALSGKTPVTLIPTFLGAHALPRNYRRKPDRYVDLVVERMLPEVARRRLARFCDVFCEPGFFTPAQSRRVLEAGKAHGLTPRIHADEFVRSGGAKLATELGAISADHLGAIRKQDIRLLARSETIATLLPGTLYFLRKPHVPPARELIRAGAAVALGSDFNPGSNLSGSLPMAMNQACLMTGLSPAEALTACTLNAAYACGVGKEVGSLTNGKRADAVLWAVDDYRQIAFEYGSPLVHTVLKGGRIVRIKPFF